MHNYILKGVFILISFTSISLMAEEMDFTMEVASGLVSVRCLQAGLTDVKVGRAHVIDMIMNKSGLSRTSAEEILASPDVVIKASDEATRIAGEIKEGRLTCDDVIMYVMGSLMPLKAK